MRLRYVHSNGARPQLYPKVVRQDPTIADPGFVEIDGYRLRPNVDLIPQRGLQEKLCASDCNLIFLTGSATGGKMQPYDAQVLTPSGFVNMGSIRVGDTMSAFSGGSQVVEAIYEHGMQDVYRITFDDGSTTECGLEHLWYVATRRSKQPYGNYETVTFRQIKEMMDSKIVEKIAVPVCRPIEFKCEDLLPCEPYAMGRRLAGIADTTQYDAAAIDKYKLASVNNRRALLKGLLAVNSYRNSKGIYSFHTDIRQLAEDIQWIARSLGGKCSFKEGYGKTSDSYTLNIDKSVFGTTGELRKIIVSYEYIGKKQCRCIRVSSEDHLYITDDFIVTHNTFGGLLASMKGLGHQNYTGRIITMQSKDNENGTSMLRDAQQIYGKFAGCNLTTSGGITAEWPHWNNAIKFIHTNFNCENPREWNEYKQHCKANTAIFMYADEATGIESWKKFAYLFSRNRDSSGAMRPKFIISFNPENEHWTTAFLKRAGYLTDDWWFKKEMNGKVTYFFAGEGDGVDDIIFGPTREAVVQAAHITVTEDEAAFGMKPEDMVKSFTCLFASPIDNKILVNITKGESIANIAAVGKTEGAKMQFGYFGPDTSSKNRITREIIARIFTNPVSPMTDPLYATLDVSAGGDLTVMWLWRGDTIIAREEIISDRPEEIRAWVSLTLARYGIRSTHFVYDGGGLGFFLREFRNGIYVTNNMRPVQEIDEFGNPTDHHRDYYDIRSQLFDKTEAMLISGEISCEIPPDTLFMHTDKKIMTPLIDILCEEKELFVWEKINGKKKCLTKKVFKARFGYSPDSMDSIVLKSRFNLDARPRKEEPAELTEESYYEGLNADCDEGFGFMENDFGWS